METNYFPFRSGYHIPILGSLVKDQYEGYKPGNMFDNKIDTYYHAIKNTAGPWIKVYFGYEEEVSSVKIINRLDKNNDYVYENLENTVISVMVEGEGVVQCGTLTNINTESGAEEDQTYTVFCGNQRGIGVLLQKQGSAASGWCISELEFYHFIGLLRVRFTTSYAKRKSLIAVSFDLHYNSTFILNALHYQIWVMPARTP